MHSAHSTPINWHPMSVHAGATANTKKADTPTKNGISASICIFLFSLRWHIQINGLPRVEAHRFLSASPAPHFVFQSAYCNFQLSLFNIPLFSHLRKSLTNFLKHFMIQRKTGEPNIRLRGNQISTLRPDVDYATVGRTLTYAFFTEMPTLGVS